MFRVFTCQNHVRVIIKTKTVGFTTGRRRQLARVVLLWRFFQRCSACHIVRIQNFWDHFIFANDLSSGDPTTISDRLSLDCGCLPSNSDETLPVSATFWGMRITLDGLQKQQISSVPCGSMCRVGSPHRPK
jgi:hypothetical protein